MFGVGGWGVEKNRKKERKNVEGKKQRKKKNTEIAHNAFYDPKPFGPGVGVAGARGADGDGGRRFIDMCPADGWMDFTRRRRRRRRGPGARRAIKCHAVRAPPHRPRRPARRLRPLAPSPFTRPRTHLSRCRVPPELVSIFFPSLTIYTYIWFLFLSISLSVSRMHAHGTGLTETRGTVYRSLVLQDHG